jgi:hypothetical protein
MEARDLFGVALRVLGVWFLFLAGYDAALLTAKLQGLMPTSTTPIGEYKFIIAYYLLAAFVVLVLADHIVNMAYGLRDENNEEPPIE